MAVDGQLVAFLVLSVIEIASAVLVVTTKRLVRAAFWLAVSLVTIAGLYLVLQAEFVFLIQIIVYAGSVPVLFLFGIMLTRRKIMEEVTEPTEGERGGSS